MKWFRNKYSLYSRLVLYTDVAKELKKRESVALAEKDVLAVKDEIIEGMVKAAKRGEHNYTHEIHSSSKGEDIVDILCKVEEFKGIRIHHKKGTYYDGDIRYIEFNWYLTWCGGVKYD
jgi:hypothetical protein